MSDLGQPMLTDFGFSTLISATSTTNEDFLKDSLRWHAPELLYDETSRQQFSKESDIWALGMTHLVSSQSFFISMIQGSVRSSTLQEILTKAKPYAELSESEVRHRLRSDGLPFEPRISTSWDQTDRFIWDLCQLCWKANSSQRVTASQLYTRLREFRRDGILEREQPEYRHGKIRNTLFNIIYSCLVLPFY